MKRILATALCILLLFGSLAGCSKTDAKPTATAVFNGSIILGRPTRTAMTASITARNTCAVFLQWGDKSGLYASRSETMSSSEAVPAVITMNGLAAGRDYFYRLCFRENEGSEFTCTDEYSFSTPKDPGAGFNFVIQSDSHLKNKADPVLYGQVMKSMAALDPDFLFDMGDTFLNDQESDAQSQSYADVAATVRQQLPYLGTVARSAPLFYTIGNHEGEYGPWLDGTQNNLAAKSTLARTAYLPNPIPNEFYSGNAQPEEPLGYVQNYYAFTWGDALFVSIDPYRYGSVATDEKADGWGWTLGETQYDWFRTTLEESKARFKFVFAHHAIGNIRGGAEVASLYEWGGKDQKGKYLFDEKRPGWGKPIHQVMKDAGVTVFFQGHDHLFAREMVDGIVYQTLPKPAEAVADQQSNFTSYPNGDVLLNSGFLNVTVDSEKVQIEYIRSYFVSSGSQADNTGAVYRYAVDRAGQVTVLESAHDVLENYGKNDTSATPPRQKGSKADAGGGKSVTGGSKAEAGGSKASGNGAAKPSVQTGIGAVPAAGMTRVPDGGFSFAIEADPHWDENSDNDLLKRTFASIAAAGPDFLLDLGDTSMAEKLASSLNDVRSRFAQAKACFDLLGGLPVYGILGNHDGESGANPQRTAWARPLRQQLFALPPAASGFSGNTSTANYYAFTVSNAQFIVLDPYSFTMEKVGQTGNNWASTLGLAQYEWLRKTLAGSRSEFKFVFIHNLAGGIGKDQRGGAEAAPYFEWGGENASGIDEFSKMRPGWEAPVHDLLVKYGVDIVFHGHDHFYARQETDGIIYQLVPQPGTPGNSVNSAADYGYLKGTFLPSAGYLRVVVTAGQATVEYIRTGSDTIPDTYSIVHPQAG